MKERIIYAGASAGKASEAARLLKGLEVEVEAVPLTPAAGLDKALEGGSVVLLLMGADKNGRDVAIRRIKNGDASPAVIAIVPAASADSARLMACVSGGLVDQIVVEGSPAGLLAAVRSEIEKKRLGEELTSLRRKYRRIRQSYSLEAKRFFELEGAFDATLENFMTALDLRDVETFGHSKTVARYSVMLAGSCGIEDKDELENIRKGALLHDVGKIAVPDAILNKPGSLDPDEWEIVRRHPEVGFGLVKNVGMVKETGNVILCHHEKFDGSGYPQGLKGREIPLEARIFAVADTLDAITSSRPYRKARDFVAAREEIVRYSGSQFDPEMVEAFLKHEPRAWERVRYETTRLVPGLETYTARRAGK